MLMADTMAIFFVVLGLLLAFPGLWLLCRGLWPRAVAGAAAICDEGVIKPFAAGLPVMVAMVFIVAILSRLGAAGKIVGAGAVCLFLMIANCGVAGLAAAVGERLAPSAGIQNSEPPWRTILRGGFALGLASLLPILGWFVILPVSMTVGCGASLLSRMRMFAAARARRGRSIASPEEAAELRAPSAIDAPGAVGAKR
jgi:hypothetical protein